MAITTNFDFKGITISSAYIKAWRYEGDKNQTRIEVGIFKDKDSEMIHSAAFTFPLDINGENPIKQAYLFLKTLPEFEDASDC